MNMIIHDMEGKGRRHFKDPLFLEGGTIEKFDKVTVNPVWNQKGYDADFYESDSYSRFLFGIPPNNTADWRALLNSVLQAAANYQ